MTNYEVFFKSDNIIYQLVSNVGVAWRGFDQQSFLNYVQGMDRAYVILKLSPRQWGAISGNINIFRD